MSNYVYVIENRGFYKIGKAQNPERRLKELKTGSPNKMQLIHKVEFSSRAFCFNAENLAHKYFEKEKVRKSFKKMIDKDHDDYEVFKYSDDIYLHIWSHYEGKGYFEIEIIIPHTAENYNEEDHVLDSVKGIDKFIEEIEDIVSNFTDPQNIHPIQYIDTHSLTGIQKISSARVPHDVYYTQRLKSDEY